MAVFRIERTRDYTVMSNHHLRNHELSLKAKGLLSMMLSLPDDWNYTTRGLAKICKEGVDAIGNALRELETAGYIVRHQLRDRQGRISDTEYVIYEQPQPRQPETPGPDGRMIEIYLVTSVAPIPMATMMGKEWGGMGQNYLRSLIALGFQAFLIIVCVAIYAVLVQSIATESDIIMAIWSCVGYTVLLCFTLFKTGSLAKSLFGAH